MKYQIRKRENVTVYLASEVAELNPKAFKKLKNNPYTGDSEEEFVKYISNLDFDECEEDGLDSKSLEELRKILEDVQMEEFGNSAEKSANAWFESGTKDEKFYRYGGFQVNCSSDEL